MDISEEVKGVLLQSAREAIRTLFTSEDFPEIDYNLYPVLARINSGAFVTITKNGHLRGCIGFIQSENTLFETVIAAARYAASSDPRFPKLTEYEFPEIKIEISILTEPVPISSYDEIKIGTHGLILYEDGKHGLLLPQVATENNFDRDQFLSAICQKTGVDPYLWKKKKLNILVFSAVVFSESEKGNKTYAHP